MLVFHSSTITIMHGPINIRSKLSLACLNSGGFLFNQCGFTSKLIVYLHD